MLLSQYFDFKQATETYVQHFIYEMPNVLNPTFLQYFMGDGRNALQCILFSMLASRAVTYDEVFTGRIIYKACAAMDPLTFLKFVNHNL